MGLTLRQMQGARRPPGIMIGFLIAAVVVWVFSLPGCARYPAGVLGQTNSYLFVTMTVQGQINPNYYYILAMQASPTSSAQDAHPENGPFAIVQVNQGVTGWGNGWVAGLITDYVMFHGGQALQYSVNCSVLANCPANVATGGVPLGPPFLAQVSQDGHSLLIGVQLTTLGLNGATTNPTETVPGGVVVNTITTDHLESVVTVQSKPVDSLDQGGLPPLIDLHQSKVVTIPAPGIVLFPSPTVTTADLQLTQDQVEVRLQ